LEKKENAEEGWNRRSKKEEMARKERTMVWMKKGKGF
jgi:hypothetical protein